MKKTYKIPTLQVVKMQPANILAGSVNGTSGADGLGKGADWSSGSANSRSSRFSRWEEDEEWEE